MRDFCWQDYCLLSDSEEILSVVILSLNRNSFLSWVTNRLFWNKDKSPETVDW
jgi:hypothetical protein